MTSRLVLPGLYYLRTDAAAHLHIHSSVCAAMPLRDKTEKQGGKKKTATPQIYDIIMWGRQFISSSGFGQEFT